MEQYKIDFTLISRYLKKILNRNHNESLIVTVRKKNGEYIVNESNNEKNLHLGHFENVLNHFGKNGWILKQISPDETELCFYRNNIHWLKRLLIRPQIFHRIRNIYEKDGKYEVGADTPFGEISSFKDLYLYSMQDVLQYLTSKYGLNFCCQIPGKNIGNENLIKVYLYKII